MTKSSIPKNEKELADRWDIETIDDLLYIMLTHGLNAVDQYHNKVDIEDVLDDFKKKKVMSDYMFSYDEIKEIETKLQVDGEIPHAETIRGKDLMARWQKHEGEIHSIMFTHGLDVIDPFGHELELKTILRLIAEEVIEISDLLFRLSDIEDLESKLDGLEPKQPDPKKNSEPEEPEPIPDDGQEATPAFCFYKNGDKWLIGEKGKEKIFNHLKGFEIIRYLILNEGKEFVVTLLDSSRKASQEDYDFNVGYAPSGVKIRPEKALDMTYEEDGEESYSLSNESVQKIVDGQTIKQTQSQIYYLKEQLSEQTDPYKELELKDTIIALEKYIKSAKRSPQKIANFKNLPKDRVRINVRKLIKTALDKISNDIPELKEILNEDTIKTGNKCLYKPDSSNPVKWILDPEG